MQYDIAAEDVVPKAPAAHLEPVLSFAWLDSGEFLDEVTVRAIVRICFQREKDAAEDALKIRVAPGKLAKQPLEVGRGEDSEQRRHERGRRTLRARRAFAGFKSASA